MRRKPLRKGLVMQVGVPVRRWFPKQRGQRIMRTRTTRQPFTAEQAAKAAERAQVRKLADQIERDQARIAELNARNCDRRNDRKLLRECTIRAEAYLQRLAAVRPEHPLITGKARSKRSRRVRNGNWKRNKN